MDEESDFINQALLVTCLSLLLEVFGHVFISIGSSFGYLLYFLNHKFVLYGIMITQWSDAGGMMGGGIFGKTPFAQTISPNKTREGLYGAIILPMILVNSVFWTTAWWTEGNFSIRMPLIDYCMLSLVVSILAVLGDLIESFIKRCANQKDAGTILSAHGGALDRIDSILIAIPFLYWYCIEFMQYTHSPNYHFDNVHILQFLKLRY